MTPKAPPKTAGPDGLMAYKNDLLIHSKTISNKIFREFFRKDLTSRAKYYNTLAAKSAHGSIEATHFRALSDLHIEILEIYGPEPPPKPKKKLQRMSLTSLIYPDFPAEYSLRLHFIERGAIRRERAADLAIYADSVFRQYAANGDCLLSVALKSNKIWLFERLVETIGESGIGMPMRKLGGFDMPFQSDVWTAVTNDNFQARLHHRRSHLGHLDPSIVLPTGLPKVPLDLPWDPDPQYQAILNLTQKNMLEEALELVEQIAPEEREILFDEIIYLRFCLGLPIRADDIRYIARKYISTSSIRSRLEEEFPCYLQELDGFLRLVGPPSAELFYLEGLKDWESFQKKLYWELENNGHPTKPRGRIFIWHPDIYANNAKWVYRSFLSDMIEAENTFRRARSIPKIGRGWVSESALLDLVRKVYPAAEFQWRPFFLGQQSIDIYVPTLNLAIEYQGEQHYRPIPLFGGEAGFAATCARDERKRVLLARNGVKLLEWPFNRPINRSELSKALVEFT